MEGECKHEHTTNIPPETNDGFTRQCMKCLRRGTTILHHIGGAPGIIEYWEPEQNDQETIIGKTESTQTIDDLPGGSTPSQYALPPDATELQDLIEYREMNFAMGNIFKACYRVKDGVDPLYDIRKIIWFAKREEARLIKEADNG